MIGHELPVCFARRREAIFAQLAEKSLFVLPAAQLVTRSGDTHYPFRQESHFHYVTGFPEPKAIAVLRQLGSTQEFILFCEPNNPETARWDGPRLGEKQATEQFGAHAAYALTEFEERMTEWLQTTTQIYAPLYREVVFTQHLLTLAASIYNKRRKQAWVLEKWCDTDILLAELRLIKDDAELHCLRQACAISAHAHIHLMQATTPGIKEYELAARFVGEVQAQGCAGEAYTSIVGSGKNACILHYIANQATLQANDLLLVDAGGEYQNYCADITRTYPVSGCFTVTQKTVYEVVLATQLAGIAAVQPGQSWEAIELAIMQEMTRGLLAIGLLQGEYAQLLENKACRQFYWHGSGHFLGLDVHDVGEYKVGEAWRTLAPGMVLTVEPGVYIPEGTEGVDPKWWNIGIRIEDDVLVTATGHEVLTSHAPKTIAEIEAVMQNSKQTRSRQNTLP